MPHAPNDPHVAASYDAMIKETMAQWRAIQKTGLKVEFIPPDAPNPYAHSPRMAMKDIRDNGHLWVYPTSTGFGTSQADDQRQSAAAQRRCQDQRQAGDGERHLPHRPRLLRSLQGGRRLPRRWRGERVAQSLGHVLAAGPAAMTAETRGQNSWVNYGPHGEKNRTATDDTIYADQKSGIMPEWVHSEGAKTAPAIVGIKALKTTPKNYKAAATLIRHYPNMPEEIAKHGTDEEVINHFHNHVVDNLLALHDLVHKAGWADRAKLWYAGGNAIVKHLAQTYGLPDHSVAGAIAALSPQKDWFQNVSLAHRVIHTLKGNGDNFYHGYALDAKMEKTFRGTGKAFQKKATKAIFNQIKGKSLGDIDKMDLSRPRPRRSTRRCGFVFTTRPTTRTASISSPRRAAGTEGDHQGRRSAQHGVGLAQGDRQGGALGHRRARRSQAHVEADGRAPQGQKLLQQPPRPLLAAWRRYHRHACGRGSSLAVSQRQLTRSVSQLRQLDLGQAEGQGAEGRIPPGGARQLGQLGSHGRARALPDLRRRLPYGGVDAWHPAARDAVDHLGGRAQPVPRQVEKGREQC
jgi:hypothetical protein